LGAAAVLATAACGGEAGESGGEAGEGGDGGETGEAGASAPAPSPATANAPAGAGGEAGEAGAASAYAGLSGDERTALRLQHLKGFVMIAARLAEAGQREEAAVLVQQGVLEVYDAAPTEFGALDIARVRSAGEPTGDINAALAAIDAARAPLQFDHAGQAARMVDIATGLYQGVVHEDYVDPIEYQHSLGAALAARDALVSGEAQLRGADAAAYAAAVREVDRLIALWPASTAPETPTPYRQLLAQSSRVRLELYPYL